MFAIGQITFGIILMALFFIALFWWLYKPLGKQLRKGKRNFIQYINNENEEEQEK